MYNPGWPDTLFADQTILKLRDPSFSTSKVLGLMACTTMPSKDLFIHCSYMHVYLCESMSGACKSPRRPGKGSRAPENGVKSGCEPLGTKPESSPRTRAFPLWVIFLVHTSDFQSINQGPINSCLVFFLFLFCLCFVLFDRVFPCGHGCTEIYSVDQTAIELTSNQSFFASQVLGIKGVCHHSLFGPIHICEM